MFEGRRKKKEQEITMKDTKLTTLSPRHECGRRTDCEGCCAKKRFRDERNGEPGNQEVGQRWDGCVSAVVPVVHIFKFYIVLGVLMSFEDLKLVQFLLYFFFFFFFFFFLVGGVGGVNYLLSFVFRDHSFEEKHRQIMMLTFWFLLFSVVLLIFVKVRSFSSCSQENYVELNYDVYCSV